MTVALRAAGAWAAGTTSVTPAIPAGTAAGDIMLLFVCGKPFSASIGTAISGWTLLSSQSNGTVASGIDTGSVIWATYYRLWQSGDTNPVITPSPQATNVILACIKSFSQTLGGWETPVEANGDDTSSDTNWDPVFASLAVTANDMVNAFAVIAGNNSVFSSPVFFGGATFGAATESPATEGSTANGHDLEASSAHALVTSGSASDTSASFVLSVAQTGGGAIVRLREAAAAAAQIPWRHRRERTMRTLLAS